MTVGSWDLWTASAVRIFSKNTNRRVRSRRNLETQETNENTTLYDLIITTILRWWHPRRAPGSVVHWRYIWPRKTTNKFFVDTLASFRQSPDIKNDHKTSLRFPFYLLVRPQYTGYRVHQGLTKLHRDLRDHYDYFKTGCRMDGWTNVRKFIGHLRAYILRLLLLRLDDVFFS
jgi:hypothetical protein